MIRTLIKKQLSELLQGYFIDKKSGKARTKKGTMLFTCLAVLLFVFCGFVFFVMAAGVGATLLGNGCDWLYFALAGMISIALGVFGSVLNTYGSLYLPKDNELMLSLPIPVHKLLFARLFAVYATGLLNVAWIWIPVLFAYAVSVPTTFVGMLVPILLTFVLALFVTVLACVLGWVVALISSKIKGKSILNVVISLGLLAIFYLVYFRIKDSIGEFMNHLDQLDNTVKTWFHYVYMIGKAAEGEIMSAVYVVGITVLLFVLCFFVLCKTFMKLVPNGEGSGSNTKDKVNFATRSAKTALLRREYKHFTSVSTWMLNGGLGLLLMLVAAVALLIKADVVYNFLTEFAQSIPGVAALLPVALLAAVCLFAAAAPLSAVSVSMEGKSLWILQSLPITPWEMLRAKEQMAVRLTLCPAAVFIFAGSLTLKLQLLRILLLCVCTVLLIFLQTDFGLYLNLKSPNLLWSNAASLTKQSMPVMVSLFGGIGFALLLCLIGFLLGKLLPIEAVLAALGVLIFALRMLLLRWLKTKGSAVLAAL